jgi:hypothetical protein
MVDLSWEGKSNTEGVTDSEQPAEGKCRSFLLCFLF